VIQISHSSRLEEIGPSVGLIGQILRNFVDARLTASELDTLIWLIARSTKAGFARINGSVYVEWNTRYTPLDGSTFTIRMEISL
jgi:hypothetical protein